MTQPSHIQKTLVMKPEVSKIFNDLEAWHDHCRLELINFDPKDLYKSKEYKDWQKTQEYLERKSRRENKSSKEKK